MQIKLAYESILQHEAGYRPPPPGSAPNAHYAEAYWHAHSADGRVPWGQFAGGLRGAAAAAVTAVANVAAVVA
jgi:hypothetical protein